ncbi:MAG: hypothetical protein ACOCRO_04425 [Halanaerobiales bacterium]
MKLVCEICGEKLKENGRDEFVLFYWCPNCDSHYHTMDDELLLVEGPSDFYKIKERD